MHWTVDNRWDCGSLVNQSESSRCLASACKPLFGIWGLMGVGLVITRNEMNSGLFTFYYNVPTWICSCCSGPWWNPHTECSLYSYTSLNWSRLCVSNPAQLFNFPLIKSRHDLQRCPLFPLCNKMFPQLAAQTLNIPFPFQYNPSYISAIIMATAQKEPAVGLLSWSPLKLWINLP